MPPINIIDQLAMPEAAEIEIEFGPPHFNLCQQEH